jgi:hypothetical protein
MRTQLLTAAALTAAAFAAGAAHAQARPQDYRCILDSVSPEDHQAAVALYSRMFIATANDEAPTSTRETEALEDRMDKLSDECAAKNHWTRARQAKVETYTGD